MKDSEFKSFSHKLPLGHEISSNGQNISVIGNYRPDISIKDASGTIQIVLESETKSDRKAFIGALTHAFKYADESNVSFTLVFVMKETGNQTTVEQVANNLRPYYVWLQGVVKTKLKGTFLVSDDAYVKSKECGERILSTEFKARCQRL
ncbi:hypothetical protein J4H25_20030 [Vibrio alginolyticus]|uniref:hypothetical protein n=1 Tax=Vibrio alginolyticus TaxID=663 RepID=UPI001BD6DE47|nr:hypothetical protein [Vibrio alginolyticus]MBE4032475.1 hypothetical protein [Vibrio parahaemolyticus]MBS9879927.1 hypothetical protein [Vibrio alginolyticus]